MGEAAPARRGLRRAALAALAALALGAAWALAREPGWLGALGDEARLRAAVEGFGAWGPVAVVAALALAIVASPIPSAPIAMAAGAAYGPLWGTALTVAGSGLGATAAFLVARFLAYDAVRAWGPVRRPLDWLERGHSQRWLMAAVLLTRLAPFLSFDAISYAAGLTPLAFWRFAVATLLGVLPVSALLAYGGDAALSLGGVDPALAVLLLGGITGLPILARAAWGRWRRR